MTFIVIKLYMQPRMIYKHGLRKYTIQRILLQPFIQIPRTHKTLSHISLPLLRPSLTNRMNKSRLHAHSRLGRISLVPHRFSARRLRRHSVHYIRIDELPDLGRLETYHVVVVRLAGHAL